MLSNINQFIVQFYYYIRDILLLKCIVCLMFSNDSFSIQDQQNVLKKDYILLK